MKLLLLFCIDTAMRDPVHDVETKHGICHLLITPENPCCKRGWSLKYYFGNVVNSFHLLVEAILIDHRSPQLIILWSNDGQNTLIIWSTFKTK